MRQKSILIVDDRPEIRELIQAALESGLYTFLSADNDRDAIALARAHRPDLVLLDIQLVGSELDGLQICKLLKSEEATRQATVVMLTAEGQTWDKQASYDAGADHYLVKPFSPIKLRQQVALWLHGEKNP